MNKRAVALALAVATIVSVGSVRAESAGLVISPPYQEVLLPSDRPIVTVPLNLTNRSTSTQTLVAQAVDFKSLDESGGVAFVGLKGEQLLRKYGLATWIHLPSGRIILAPGQSERVIAQIDNSSEVAAGGHYGAVIFRVEGTAPAQKGTNLGVQQVFASLIFADKPNGARRGLRLGSLELPKNWLSRDLRVGMNFENTGTVHVIPRGTVTLTNVRGVVVRQGIINQDSKIILPETKRVIPVHLQYIDAITYGTYRLTATYRYDGTDKTQTISRTIRIVNWLFVFLLVLGFVIVVFAMFGGTYWLKKRRKK